MTSAAAEQAAHHGVGVAELVGRVRSGGHRDAARPAGPGAPHVEGRVADHHGRLGAPGRGPGPGDRHGDQRVAPLVIGAERALARREEAGEPDVGHLRPCDRLQVARQQREGDPGPGEALQGGRGVRRGPRRRAGLSGRVPRRGARRHRRHAPVDLPPAHAGGAQHEAHDLRIGAAAGPDRRHVLDPDGNPVHLGHRAGERLGVGPRAAVQQRAVDVHEDQHHGAG